MKRWHLAGYVFLAVVAALLLSVAAGAQDTCEEADALYNLKLYDEAQKAYIELLKNDTHLTYAQSGINKSRQKKAEEFYLLGEAYKKARQYDLARDAYTKALEINQTLACAQSGINESLQKKAEEFYRLGIAYEKAKEYKSARDAYIKALEIDPTFNKSYEALNQVSNRLFTEVRTLAGMELYAEAGEKLKKVVEENPGIDVPKNLTYLFGWKMGPLRQFWIGIEPWIHTIGEILAVLVIIALAGFIMYRRICPWIYNSCKPRLDIEDFDKGATDLDIGKGLAAMVEVSFKQIRESGAHGSRPSLIDGSIEKLEIPADVKSLHPYIKIVSALIEWLFRPDVYTLSGYLQKPGGALGAGLTLSLVRKRSGEIEANRTIWQKDFDPAITPPEEKDPAPYYRLAEPAAIWTIFHEKLPFNKKLALLGTRDWLSFAYFRAGVRWAREGRDNKARKLYVEALSQDTGNRGARFNLGALDTEAGEKKYDRAIERLEMAREKYLFSWDNIPRDDSGDSSPRDDSGRLRRFLVDDFGIDWAENAEIRKPDGDQIVSIIKDENSAKIELDKSKKKAILKISDGRTPELKVEMPYLFSIDAEFDEKLDNSGTPSEELKKEFEKNGFSLPDNAAVNIEEEKKKWLITSEKEFIIEKEKGKLNIYEKENKLYKRFLEEPVWYKATYQLAAIYSYQGKQQQAVKEAKSLVRTIQETINAQPKNEDNALRKFLESFELMSVIMYAGILASDNKKGEKEETELRIKILKSNSTEFSYCIIKRGENDRCESEKLTYRSHYNLACYYSESGNNEKALDHLEYALERGGEIVQWAKNDPSLKGLREDKKCKFYERIEKYSAPVTPSTDLLPLAGLRLIGATYAKQLKEQGIVSHDDLILKADTPEARKKLAKNLCINTKLLQRWALLADMMRIVGIDTQYANLLEAAGVRSLDDLANIPHIDTLVDSLCKLNDQCLVKQLLSVEIVKQWKEDTKIIAPKVSV